MINNISLAISRWLVRTGTISKDDQDLYTYAAFCFMFNLVPLVISFSLGIIMGMVIESLLFILPYVLLRTFSGGFHLQSSKLCFCISTLLLLISLLLLKILSTDSYSPCFFFSVLLAGSIIFIMSPIDSEERRLSYEEIQFFKRIAKILVITLFFTYLITSLLGKHIFSHSIGAGIILTALLQLPCLIRKTRQISLHHKPQ